MVTHLQTTSYTRRMYGYVAFVPVDSEHESIVNGNTITNICTPFRVECTQEILKDTQKHTNTHTQQVVCSTYWDTAHTHTTQ